MAGEPRSITRVEDIPDSDGLVDYPHELTIDGEECVIPFKLRRPEFPAGFFAALGDADARRSEAIQAYARAGGKGKPPKDGEATLHLVAEALVVEPSDFRTPDGLSAIPATERTFLAKKLLAAVGMGPDFLRSASGLDDLEALEGLMQSLTSAQQQDAASTLPSPSSSLEGAESSSPQSEPGTSSLDETPSSTGSTATSSETRDKSPVPSTEPQSTPSSA